MKTIKILLIISTIGILVLAFNSFEVSKDSKDISKEVPVGGFDSFNRFGLPNASTSQKILVGTSVTTIVATNTSRQYAIIVNDSSSTVYLSLGGLPAGEQGIRLNAGGSSYEINPNNLFLGAVYGIASSTANLTVTER